jgi:hypothetical protein
VGYLHAFNFRVQLTALSDMKPEVMVEQSAKLLRVLDALG